MEYRGATISLRNQSNFGFRDVLELLRPYVRGASWKLAGVECFGPGANELHKISDDGTNIEGSKLLALMETVVQVIAGDFHATILGTSEEWRLNVVRGSEIDVVTDNLEIIDLVRKNCLNVVKLDES